MVFLAIVLFTVSTLAVHGEEVSTDGPIIPGGCEGKSFCDEKPADYPQEEIDYFLKNNPAFVRRMKREADLAGFQGCEESQELELEKASAGGNCQTEIKCVEPFLKVDKERVPHVIVDSQFFNQKIRQVFCSSPGTQCFGKLTRWKAPAKCKQIAVNSTLYVYDKKTRQVRNETGEIYVDCACELDLLF